MDFQVTLREFANEWFYEDFKRTVSLRNFRGMCFDMDHILPAFGDKLLSEITMEDMTIFYNALERGGYSHSTIRNFHVLLSIIFYEALKRGLIKNSPIEGHRAGL